MSFKRLRRAACAAALLTAGLAAQATTVTYTFTEYDGNNIVYQLRHSLDHFLDPASFETLSFSLADVVVDPWGALGAATVELDNQGFGALPGFVTFNGAYFYGNKFPNLDVHDPGNELFAVSYDMHVTDRTAGTWIAGDDRLDITVSNDPPSTGTVPEPASLALLAAALMALRLHRRAR